MASPTGIYASTANRRQRTWQLRRRRLRMIGRTRSGVVAAWIPVVTLAALTGERYLG